MSRSRILDSNTVFAMRIVDTSTREKSLSAVRHCWTEIQTISILCCDATLGDFCVNLLPLQGLFFAMEEFEMVLVHGLDLG